MSEFRRRLMMSALRPTPPYPDPWVDDGWIWAYYDVTTTESATTLIYDNLSYLGATFIIDGVEVARTASYTFDTVGEHLVKMQCSGAVRANTFRVSRLVRIYFPDTVTGIGEACFLNDANLSHVWLPDTITTITNRAFEGCSSLRVINVDNTSITTVNGSSNYGTFRYCTSLRKLHFPVTVTSFEQRSVQGCSSLIDVNLSDLTSLVSIGALAFGSDTKLRGTWKAPSTFTTLGNQSFASTKLEEVDLGDSSVTTIPGSTNFGCFQACSVLSKVILPDTTTTLQQRAFYQCYALATVICKATTPPTISGQSLPGTSYVQHIYVPAESVEDYKAASGWSSYASKIEAIPTT